MKMSRIMMMKTQMKSWMYSTVTSMLFLVKDELSFVLSSVTFCNGVVDVVVAVIVADVVELVNVVVVDFAVFIVDVVVVDVVVVDVVLANVVFVDVEVVDVEVFVVVVDDDVEVILSSCDNLQYLKNNSSIDL